MLALALVAAALAVGHADGHPIAFPNGIAVHSGTADRFEKQPDELITWSGRRVRYHRSVPPHASSRGGSVAAATFDGITVDGRPLAIELDCQGCSVELDDAAISPDGTMVAFLATTTYPSVQPPHNVPAQAYAVPATAARRS
jgi:hypothetical protein